MILIGWFQIFGVRRNAGFSLVDLNSFAPIFGALNSSENFDAMNVRRDETPPKETSYLISELWHFGQMRRPQGAEETGYNTDPQHNDVRSVHR